MTSRFTAARQLQVEECLGRPLTSDELIEVASLEALTPVHLAVVHALARRYSVTCIIYLEGVVEGIPIGDAVEFTTRIHDALARP